MPPESYLHDHPDFPALLRIVSEEKSIVPALVEKDYWIMHCLYGLKKMGLSFELKGGTSLSKGFGLIHRFSEDIDIRIAPPVDTTYPENRREAALQRAKMIAKRLARNPDRFAEQAMKHSECPTALQGGEIGRVKRGSLHPELDTVLFQMREGAVSDVVESEVGYHVLLCEKIHAAGIAPPAEVLPKLLEQMQERAVSRAQKCWVEQLLKNH